VRHPLGTQERLDRVDGVGAFELSGLAHHSASCFALASLVEAVAEDGDTFLGGFCDHLKFAVTVECRIQPFSTSVAQPRVTQAVQAMYLAHHLC